MKPKFKSEDRYFLLIPLPLIQGLIQSPSPLEKMAAVGAYLSAKKSSFEVKKCLHIFVVMRYRCGHLMDKSLTSWFDKLDRDGYPLQKELVGQYFVDEVQNKVTHDIHPEMQFLDEYIDQNPEFRVVLEAWLRTSCMLHRIHIHLDENTVQFHEKAISLLHEHPEYVSGPFISLDGEVFRNMYTAARRSTEDLRARWCIYMGMLSIIGTKELAATTSIAIKSRMFGAKNNEVLCEVLSDEETSRLYAYWTTRRRYERLLAEVEFSNKIKSQGVGRKTYISYYYKTDKDFVEAVFRSQMQGKITEIKKCRSKDIKERITDAIAKMNSYSK